MEIDWNKVVKRYRKKLKKHGASHKTLKWKSEDAMLTRHKELLKDLEIAKKTILDVGCGFGDIVKSLKSKAHGVKFSYCGVDIVREFIEIAREKYPEYKFYVKNYFEHPYKRKFDIILCCGALNSNFGKQTIPFRKHAIKTMFDHCNYATAFNMAGSTPKPRNRNGNVVYYANSLEILKFCISITRKVVFRHHYRLKDFTIIMFR